MSAFDKEIFGAALSHTLPKLYNITVGVNAPYNKNIEKHMSMHKR